ncbi:hypothetical protein V8C42DRAFT_26333 [Trichoderma barbatum]
MAAINVVGVARSYRTHSIPQMDWIAIWVGGVAMLAGIACYFSPDSPTPPVLRDASSACPGHCTCGVVQYECRQSRRQRQRNWRRLVVGQVWMTGRLSSEQMPIHPTHRYLVSVPEKRETPSSHLAIFQNTKNWGVVVVAQKKTHHQKKSQTLKWAWIPNRRLTAASPYLGSPQKLISSVCLCLSSHLLLLSLSPLSRTLCFSTQLNSTHSSSLLGWL